MHCHTFIVPILAIGSSIAIPLQKRLSTPEVNDGIILNYSLTLEYLQRAFYHEGLNNFKQRDFMEAGFENPFYDNLQQIYQDQQNHVDFLIQALQAAEIPHTEERSYNFPYSDVASWVALAGILEGLSTSAYLGSAALIVDRDYLAASNSILSSEARHASYLRAALSESPSPYSFETPLSFNEVYTLAALFIPKGANPVHLPFQAFPDLNLQCSPYYYEEGRSSVTFSGAFEEANKLGVKETTPIFAIFYSGLMKIPVRVRLSGNEKDYKIDKIPDGVLGQCYIVLSRSDYNFSDEQVIAGPAILEVALLHLLPIYCFTADVYA
ncbi:MAG: hypothetical protein Q9217_002466 [Psora testacea]